MNGAEELLSLNEVAERLGLHYNTVYRYVRRGRLRAHQSDGVWRVPASSLDDLVHNRATGRKGERNWDTHRQRILARLVDGDVEGSWDILAACLDGGASAPDVHRELLGPSLAQIGELWAQGLVEIEAEHRATAAVLTLRGRLSGRFLRRGRTRGAVLLGAAPGDHHAVATALLGDLLRSEGYHPVDLGGDVPVESWRRVVGRDRFIAVAIYAAAPPDDAAREAVAAVRDAGGADTTIIVGGRAIESEQHAVSIGADRFGDTVEAVFDAVADAAERSD